MNVPFTFTLAGDGQIPYFETKAKELGVENNVKFVGLKKSDELNYLYSSSDIFLFPSIFDTDGLVVKEAAAKGTPSLVIKNTGAAEQIEDGVNGWALDNDIDAFADKVEEIYNMKKNFPNEYLELRESTKNKPIPLWKDIADEYLALYRQRVE